MPWTYEQQNRLQLEKKYIKQFFPSFEWFNPTLPGSAYIEGWMKSNAGNQYKLRLIIPYDVPNSVPVLLVMYPKPLYNYYSQNMANLGFSALMHVLTPVDGYVQICHYKSSLWTPSITFYKVLIKGRLWIEAYEGHKKTGNFIDKYLRHQS